MRERERERVRVVEKEGESERVTCLMSNCTSQCRDRIDALSDLAPPCVGGNAMGISGPQDGNKLKAEKMRESLNPDF